jgi:hypothetical protein
MLGRIIPGSTARWSLFAERASGLTRDNVGDRCRRLGAPRRSTSPARRAHARARTVRHHARVRLLAASAGLSGWRTGSIPTTSPPCDAPTICGFSNGRPANACSSSPGGSSPASSRPRTLPMSEWRAAVSGSSTRSSSSIWAALRRRFPLPGAVRSGRRSAARRRLSPARTLPGASIRDPRSRHDLLGRR